ncbi:MAG TPA: hypothetical protein DIS74_08560 [Bacteroidales bacterium]|nr:hypothetical protein [Bacteroidales bacterium]
MRSASFCRAGPAVACEGRAATAAVTAWADCTVVADWAVGGAPAVEGVSEVGAVWAAGAICTAGAAPAVGAVWAADGTEKAISRATASIETIDRAINLLIIYCFTGLYEKSNPEIYAGES